MTNDNLIGKAIANSTGCITTTDLCGTVSTGCTVTLTNDWYNPNQYLYWNGSTLSTTTNNNDNMKSEETKEALEVMMLAPGVELEDVEVYVRRGTIYVELDMDDEVPGYSSLQKEFSISVDEDEYDVNDISASLALGVLMVHVPKKKADIVVKVKG